MALRLMSLALCAALALVVGSTDTTPPRDLTRHKIDVKLDSSRQPTNRRVTSTARLPVTESVVDAPTGLPPDTVALDYPFAAADVDELVRDGTIEIPHPEGGLLELTLRDARYEQGSRVVRVLSDGLPGVITQRGQRLIGTIATRSGVYSLSSHLSGSSNAPPLTRLIDQRQLDLRVAPNRQDYRHVPHRPPAA